MTLAPARPLRAVVLVMALWSAGRGTYLWLGTDPKSNIASVADPLPPVPSKALAVFVDDAQAQMPTFSTPPDTVPTAYASRPRPRQQPWPKAAVAGARPPAIPFFAARVAELGFSQGDAPAATTRPIASTMPGLAPTGVPTWSGSFWFAGREGAAAMLAPGQGQLGGSQMGLRVYRPLSPAVALTGRVSTALATRGGEVSTGIALRRGPVALLAERRFALDGGGRNAWSLTAVAGMSDIALPLDMRLDGYAQAGVVGRDGFADGAVRIERAIIGGGTSRLSVGGGMWGSIQPGLSRLDIGPQLVAHTALGGRAVRISAEWRQRLAGNAAPGSGPALTLGTDF